VVWKVAGPLQRSESVHFALSGICRSSAFRALRHFALSGISRRQAFVASSAARKGKQNPPNARRINCAGGSTPWRVHRLDSRDAVSFDGTLTGGDYTRDNVSYSTDLDQMGAIVGPEALQAAPAAGPPAR
jgi:hypothetical protein